ncbi:PLA2G10 [Bugula neritina]|uniref:Phospholipase A2 n=1 Tax=Bugula neritina TaxID=10212 RepID=A0A7J7JZU7_BUGNE|nr:PLA2G10 [Bugula neritina]
MNDLLRTVTRVLLSVLWIAQCEGGFFQFYTMIRNIAQVEPTKFLQYGCYCGLGNSGTQRVVDCMDMCCYHHDYCIEDLKEPCPKEYNTYSSTSYQYNSTTMQCLPDQDECRFKVCKCDYDFAQCTKIYKSLYKGDCVRTKDTFICHNQDNYTLPTCQKDLVPEMKESTRDVCSPSKLMPPVPPSLNKSHIVVTIQTDKIGGFTTPNSANSSSIFLNLNLTLGEAVILCLLSVLLNPVVLP